MDFEKLNAELAKLDELERQRIIEMNKLKAYYWVLNNFKIRAENIDKITYRPGQDKSFIEMKSDDEYSQEFIECQGNIHNILMGLDTSYEQQHNPPLS